MEAIKLQKLIDACKGEFSGDTQLLEFKIDNISLNSKEVTSSTLFIPVKGEVHDAHKFIDSAFSNGCKCTLSEIPLIDHDYILVESTFRALKDIARYYRGLFDIKVIAITGSVGKTTVKELIASVLGQKYNVLKSIGNLNNEFGLPQTLFNINSQHEIAVVEMGMNNFGEIDRLSKTAMPDVCVIMNIGESHIGRLGSREGIFKAKCEIFNHMKDNGLVYLNGDDDMLITLIESNLKPTFFGKESSNDVNVKKIINADIEGSTFLADIRGEEVEFRIPVPGLYMLDAALCAIVIGKDFNLSNTEIKAGIEKYKNVNMRKNIIKNDSITIIDDTYNSCTNSVLAGLDVLNLATGRKVAIIGDILEVEEHGVRIHYELGEKAGKKDIDLTICCGAMSINTYKGLLKTTDKKVLYFESQEIMLSELSKIIKYGDVIYIKASRGCGFEKTVKLLTEMF